MPGLSLRACRPVAERSAERPRSIAAFPLSAILPVRCWRGVPEESCDARCGGAAAAPPPPPPLLRGSSFLAPLLWPLLGLWEGHRAMARVRSMNDAIACDSTRLPCWPAASLVPCVGAPCALAAEVRCGVAAGGEALPEDLSAGGADAGAGAGAGATLVEGSPADGTFAGAGAGTMRELCAFMPAAALMTSSAFSSSSCACCTAATEFAAAAGDACASVDVWPEGCAHARLSGTGAAGAVDSKVPRSAHALP